MAGSGERDGADAVASDGALDSLEALAGWYGDKADELARRAERQFSVIVAVVAVGLAFLLVLPGVIAQIDSLWGSRLPNDVVADGDAAVVDLNGEIAEANGEIDRRSAESDAAIKQLVAHQLAYDGLLDGLKAALTAPVAVWRRTQLDESSAVTAFARSPDGSVLAAGYDEGADGKQVLLLRSPDGVDWSPTYLNHAGARMKGRLNALMVTRRGQLMAAGSEGGLQNPGALLLRSTNGADWTPIRPRDTEARVEGALYALTATPDGLLAAGAEQTGGVLLLRSTNGADWTPIRPTETGVQLEGQLYALAATSNGTLLAAGAEPIFDRRGGDGLLLLRSSDGADWTPIRPIEASERIRGKLNALIVTPNGGLLAAGYEGYIRDTELLLLRSTDGMAWTPIRPAESGMRIKGELLSLRATPDGGLLAAGYEQNTGALLLRSADGETWTPIRLADAQGRIRGSHNALGLASDGGLLTTGASGTLYHNAMPDTAATLLDTLPVASEIGPDRAAIGAAFDTLEAVLSQPNLVYSETMSTARKGAPALQTDWLASLADVERLENLRSDLESAQKTREGLKTIIEGQTGELRKSFAEADPFNQAARIATRVAVIALLIYLVQMVFNRYRYLQKLSGFYNGRARALNVLAVSAENGGAPLRDVSATELMKAMSPDTIGFDKSGEPPTQQMVDLFRDAIKQTPGR